MRFGGYHPKLAAFIGEWERQISEQGERDWAYLTSEEIWFLEEVWGRVAHFDYTNLKPGFPLDGHEPLGFCTYFQYFSRKNKRPVVFEIPDYRAARMELSADQYTKMLERKELLESEGYIVVRLIKMDDPYELRDARDAVLHALSRSVM